jgi:diaminopimelate epimerase
MRLPFWKMHGAGNDFVLVDNRDGIFPATDGAWVAGVCRRRTGIGSDGVVLIEASTEADFRMRFLNPDGGEAEMCGNAARCVAHLARDIGVAPDAMEIETAAGRLSATVLPGARVRIGMPDPLDWTVEAELDACNRRLTYDKLNTGVPHVVIRVPDVDTVDVAGLGRAIRRQPAFAPDGTNANFVQVGEGGRIRVRTYERGVEAETLACGTGVTAVALVLDRLGIASSPVAVQVAGGDTLTVSFSGHGDSARDVQLEGPIAYVFRGELEYGT